MKRIAAALLLAICTIALALSTDAQTKNRKPSTAKRTWEFTQVAMPKPDAERVCIYRTPSTSAQVLCRVVDHDVNNPERMKYEWLSAAESERLGDELIGYVTLDSSPIFEQSGQWLKVAAYFFGNYYGWVKKSGCEIESVTPITAADLRREGCYVVGSGVYRNYVLGYMPDGLEEEYIGNDELISIGRLVDGKYVEERYVTLTACRKAFGAQNFTLDTETPRIEISRYTDSAMKRLLNQSKKPFWWPAINFRVGDSKNSFLDCN